MNTVGEQRAPGVSAREERERDRDDMRSRSESRSFYEDSERQERQEKWEKRSDSRSRRRETAHDRRQRMEEYTRVSEEAQQLGEQASENFIVQQAKQELKTILETYNLVPLKNFCRVMLDIDDKKGSINNRGAWLFSESVVGCVNATEDEMGLLIIAAGRYKKNVDDDRLIEPTILVCGAIKEDDFSFKTAYMFENNSADLTTHLREKEFRSHIQKLGGSIKNGSIYSKQVDQ